MNNLTFIVYDSITNSVFTSMVLEPLLKQIEDDKTLNVWLVSFEREKLSNEKILEKIPAHDRLHFVVAQKFRFFGRASLIPAIRQLRRLNIPSDNIIARGPLAGYIAIKAFNKKVKVQARGLAAEEYRFVKKLNFITNFLYQELRRVEHFTYNSKHASIEAVSSALKKYLTKTFGANQNKITITSHDIPMKINPAKRQYFKTQVREKLKIESDVKAYCYSGSAKSWQCINETIKYFEEELKKDDKIFLLILSNEVEKFKTILNHSFIPSSKYYITNVNQELLPKYLAACDYGMLFRNDDVVNWVSRPTKMLEYQSVGLKIIHNNTIAELSDQK